MALFLLARMLYTDAKVAILAYAGIYAGGVFGWELAELLLFAVLLAPFSISGGSIRGWLDDTLGSKRAIQISVGLTCIGMVGAVATTPDRILFVFPYDAAAAGPLWSFPYFQTLPEVVYLLTFALLAITITAAFLHQPNDDGAHRPRLDDEPVLRPVRLVRHGDRFPRPRARGGFYARLSQPGGWIRLADHPVACGVGRDVPSAREERAADIVD